MYGEFENGRKKEKKSLTFRSGDSNPRFSNNSRPLFDFLLKIRVTRSNQKKLLKSFLLYFKQIAALDQSCFIYSLVMDISITAPLSIQKGEFLEFKM